MKALPKRNKEKTGWRCPKCGREFPIKLAFHSCGNYTVEGYLAAKNPHAVHLFQTLVKIAQSFGEFDLAPTKTQISFRRRVNFLMVSVSGRRIHGYLFLNRPVSLPCFKKVVAASANRHVHVFKIADETSLRGEFSNLVGEAFRNAGEEDDNPKSKSTASCIGEEINAIYRQARLQSAARF